MYLEIDFNSEEPLYMQLCNQIILGIAASRFKEGQSLPSVRQLASEIGINMHTVNKAYSALKQEGFLKVDRRHGAVISLTGNKKEALAGMREEMRVIVAKGKCRGISPKEMHSLLDGLYDSCGIDMG